MAPLRVRVCERSLFAEDDVVSGRQESVQGNDVNEPIQEKLRALRKGLEDLAAYPWERVEEWIASAQPLIKAHYREHFDNFEAVTTEPDWHPHFYGIPSRYDDSARDTRAETADDDRANRKLAKAAKCRILSFVDGLLKLPEPRAEMHGVPGPQPQPVPRIAAAGPAGLEPQASPPIDIGILTIREDEFRAVLQVFPNNRKLVRGRRHYNLRTADAGNGQTYRIAILRQIEQGNGEALDAARDVIEELRPRLLLVVGIAGGVPSDDFTLGDVIVSTRINDYSVEARKEGEAPSYNISGGPIAKNVAAGVANLPAMEEELGDWATGLPSRPEVDTDRADVSGPPEWLKKVRETLRHHFDPQHARPPLVTAGILASSDRLVKDPNVLFPWIQTARHIAAVEMESGGVYRAARERVPMLAIRGISDIVGLKRDDRWTKYACASAAAFARAYLRATPIPPSPAEITATPLAETSSSYNILDKRSAYLTTGTYASMGWEQLVDAFADLLSFIRGLKHGAHFEHLLKRHIEPPWQPATVRAYIIGPDTDLARQRAEEEKADLAERRNLAAEYRAKIDRARPAIEALLNEIRMSQNVG